jgi:hypothetical protein
MDGDRDILEPDYLADCSILLSAASSLENIAVNVALPGTESAGARLLRQFERAAAIRAAVSDAESLAASFIRARIAKGTVVHTDEAAFWDNPDERFEIKRIRRRTASTARALTWLRGTSSASDAPRSTSTLISSAPTSSATSAPRPSKGRVVVTP